jgi:hypothetical protein
MIIFSDHAEMVAKEMELEISMHGQDVWRAKPLSRESNQDSLVWGHIMSSHIADLRGGKEGTWTLNTGGKIQDKAVFVVAPVKRH